MSGDTGGPGQIAREILVHCDVHTYVALDFSPVMHDIAAEHLGPLASRVTFVTRDFREPAWPGDLGTFDAIVTLQAAHETRHKRHLVSLLERARTAVAPGGDGRAHGDRSGCEDLAGWARRPWDTDVREYGVCGTATYIMACRRPPGGALG